MEQEQGQRIAEEVCVDCLEEGMILARQRFFERYIKGQVAQFHSFDNASKEGLSIRHEMRELWKCYRHGVGLALQHIGYFELVGNIQRFRDSVVLSFLQSTGRWHSAEEISNQTTIPMGRSTDEVRGILKEFIRRGLVERAGRTKATRYRAMSEA